MLQSFLRRVDLGRLAHGTILGTAWQFVRILTQAAWVVLIARALGPDWYGQLAGSAALATTMAAAVGVGAGLVLLKSVSVDKSSYDRHWHASLRLTLLTGFAFTILFSLLVGRLTASSPTVEFTVAVGLSELVCFPVVYLSGYAFQAHERFGWAGFVVSAMSAARLVAVAAFLGLSTSRNLTAYSRWHLAASMFGALVALFCTNAMLRPRRPDAPVRAMERLGEGVGFASTWFTGNALTELDKTLALRLAGAEIAGVYSIAYRLASALTLPIASLAIAAQPRLFRIGPDHKPRSRLIKALVLAATAYGASVSALMLVLSNFVPALLGSSFAPAASAVRMLALIPPLYALRLIGNAVLMTSGRQSNRVMAEVAALVFMLALAVLVVPSNGLSGMAVVVTSTEAFLAATIWTLLGTTLFRPRADPDAGA